MTEITNLFNHVWKFQQAYYMHAAVLIMAGYGAVYGVTAYLGKRNK